MCMYMLQPSMHLAIGIIPVMWSITLAPMNIIILILYDTVEQQSPILTC